LLVDIEFDSKKKLSASVFNKYFTYEEALKYLVTKQENKLCFSQKDIPITTGGKDYIYVMDINGNLFISEDKIFTNSKGEIFRLNENLHYVNSKGCEFKSTPELNSELKKITHSAFTRGEPVSCAGQIKISGGKIVAINNNDDGHYKPGPHTLYRTVSTLKERGVLDDKCKIEDKTGLFFMPEEKKEKTELSYSEYLNLYNNNILTTNINE